MDGLALSAEQRVDAPPAAVFALFGTGAGAGWVFDAACERLAVGTAVTLHAPLGGPGGGRVSVLGRITAVRPGSRIEIRHDQPWRGRLRLLFDPDGPGTRVRLIADLDGAGLEWLMRLRGHPLRDAPRPAGHAIG